LQWRIGGSTSDDHRNADHFAIDLMDQGYLLLETHPEHPGLVHVRTSTQVSLTPPPNLRFAARFRDIDAALMHFHEGLRRRLVDLDARLYRADITEAIAIADAIDLEHRRVFIDPAIAGDPRLDANLARRRSRHRRWDLIFNGIGLAALALLLFRVLTGT